MSKKNWFELLFLILMALFMSAVCAIRVIGQEPQRDYYSGKVVKCKLVVTRHYRGVSGEMYQYPKDLARSLLEDALISYPEYAEAMAPKFHREVVATLPGPRWELDLSTVMAWIRANYPHGWNRSRNWGR